MKTRTKLSRAAVLAVALLFGGAAAQATTIALNFSSVPGSTIIFNGDSFTINPAPGGRFVGDQWHVVTESYVTGGLGIQGTMLNGTGGTTWDYSTPAPIPGGYGSIITPDAVGTQSTLKLTGAIPGGGTQTITCNLNWGGQGIQTAGPGLAGSMPPYLNYDVVPVSYSGWGNTALDAVWNAFLAGDKTSLVMAFSFAPGVSLNQLSSGPVYATSYTGRLVVDPVPEAGTVISGFAGMVMVLGLVMIQGARRSCVKL